MRKIERTTQPRQNDGGFWKHHLVATLRGLSPWKIADELYSSGPSTTETFTNLAQTYGSRDFFETILRDEHDAYAQAVSPGITQEGTNEWAFRLPDGNLKIFKAKLSRDPIHGYFKYDNKYILEADTDPLGRKNIWLSAKKSMKFDSDGKMIDNRDKVNRWITGDLEALKIRAGAVARSMGRFGGTMFGLRFPHSWEWNVKISNS